jgi:hypothetical protein
MRPYRAAFMAWMFIGFAAWIGCPGDDYDPDDDSAADDDDATGDDDDVADDDDSAGDDDDFTGNHPPTTPEVHIDPAEPFAQDTLTCVIDVESTDVDNDPIAYAYVWLQNGADSGITAESVPPQATVDMDEWTCQVRAFDGQDFSDQVEDSVLVGPAQPGGCRFDVSFTASGGSGPGSANVSLTWTMIDSTQTQNELCAYEYAYNASYPEILPGLGDDYYPYIDLLITFTTGTELSSTCPEAYDEFAATADPIGAVEWFISPLALITCDQIDTVPDLAAEQYIDDLYSAGLSNGTLGAWCHEFGPIAETTWGYGPMEGVWIRPADSASGAMGYGINYFEAPNGDIGGLGTFDSWSAMGTVFADPSNPNEPAAGIEGDYVTVPIWVFGYS